MSFRSLQKELPSKFEELVLTSIREIGHGATFLQIFRKAEELGRMEIKSANLRRALYWLNDLGFVHSWSDEESEDPWRNPETRHFRLQLRGERLLEAVSDRRGDSAQRRAPASGSHTMTVLWNWLWRGRKP